MLYAFLAILGGLLLLVWSADRFVDGAAAAARHLGMPPLLIGIVIIGFGTSVPEMLVSALSALNDNPGIALGNAYGSNITNIGLILGFTALIIPLSVNSQVLKQELPILIFVTALSAYLLYDGDISRFDAVVLLGVFALYMVWTVWQGLRNKEDNLSADAQHALDDQLGMTLPRALCWIFIGLGLLMLSSQALIWGAVQVAQYFGVSDLVIGLTIVAVGTSLPEFASSIAAARKGEADLAVGNIIGSNLFNTLAVVGIAGAIAPMQAGDPVFHRDISVMSAFTVLLFLFGFGLKQAGHISRFKGLLFLIGYIAYNTYLIQTAL